MAEEPGALSKRLRLLAMTTGLIAGFVMVLGGTITNVAIPDVMGAFGVGQDTAQFLATAYIATMTASQLLAAWFVAVFGRRASYSMVMLVFVGAGLTCALAPTIEILIAGRVIQGFCAGIIQPLVMTTIISLYPPEQRGRAIGLYVGMLGLAVGFGPVVGGITTDLLGWRWIFLISLPFIGVSLVLGALFMPEEQGPREKTPFDWWGYGLLCLALMGLMSAIANGHREGWSSSIVLTYWGVGLSATLAFILTQQHRANRLLDFSLFADPRFASAIALAIVFGMANFSTAYAIPVFGQLVLNLTPSSAGLVLLPAGILSSLATIMVGRMADRVPPLLLIYTGIALFVVGTVSLSRGDANTPIALLLILAIFCRLGHSFMGPSITATAIRAIPPKDINRASGTINFFRQMGGAFGINCMVAAIESRTSQHAHNLAMTQTAANDTTASFLDSARELLLPSGLPDVLAGQVAMNFLRASVSAQADALAWRDGFLLLTAVILFAGVPAFLLWRAQRAQAS
ncbi:MAG: DHA2 family efflux MFS transporter permease subunit [Pseudomonadota bacterium]